MSEHAFEASLIPGICIRCRNRHEPPPFDGRTYEPARDGDRLGRQLTCVRQQLMDYRWHTLPELSAACQGSEASCSARIRDLRKSKFGGFDIEREYVVNGLWRYRMKPKVTA